VKSILRRLPPAPRRRGIGGRPSPALVISVVALFVSLSGVSYGVATGFIDSREIRNNEIRSLDIRNNEVRTRDLRNNDIRGIDIRNSTVQGRDIALNTVTGEDVREDSLQKVPSALLADSATSATNATTADGVKTLKIIPATTLAVGVQPVTLATHGPLTLSGECATGEIARLTVSTTENDSAATGTSTPVHPGPVYSAHGFMEPDLDANEGAFRIAELQAGMAIRGYTVTTASALAPSGKGFNGEVAMFRDSTGGGSCRFHGSLALQG
jgi:hypothetical protein